MKTSAAVGMGVVGLVGVVVSIVVAVLLAVGVAAVTLLMWLNGAFHTVSTTEASNTIAASRLEYDDCTRTVEGTLTGRRTSDRGQPVTVTITASVPGDPTVHRATATTGDQIDGTKAIQFKLTDEQAAAFGHPDARRTVKIVRQDGQLVMAETEWPK